MLEKFLNEFKLGNYKLAEKLTLNYLKNNNKDYKAYQLLGRIYKQKKLYKKSISNYKKSLAIKKDKKIFLEYGNLYLELNDITKALLIYKKLLLLDRHNALAINNISYCYMLKNNYKNSKKYIKKAIKLDLNNEYLYFNLGNLNKRFGKLNSAISAYDKAIEINPNNVNFKYNKSYVLLKKKSYQEGWKIYDNRILAEYTDTKIYKLVKNNIYTGNKTPKNLNIIIIPEQGIGDHILFSSMYKEFIEINPNCKIIIDKRLKSIFKRSFNFSDFIYLSDLNKISYYVKKKYLFIYAGSLGKFFRNKLSDFSGEPYLFSKKQLYNKYSDKISKDKNKIFIGISWKSQSTSMQRKSFELKDFKKLFKIEKYCFINLQYGNVTNEISQFNKKRKNKLIDITNLDKFNDLDNLSALITSLDLVITVSNINTNLSSSLGIETWNISYDDNEHFFYSKSNKKNCEWHKKLKMFYVKNNINDTILNIFNELKKRF
tara:strand:- start:2047 stop:3507 length:1461 start_codon:yes stop_codon:yes gene_type:complete